MRAVAAAALLLLAACDRTPAVTAAPAPAAAAAEIATAPTGTGLTVGDDGRIDLAGQEVQCMAYLALQREAVRAGKATGDAKALQAALDAFDALALTTMTRDEVDQYFASSVAVEDDASPAKIKATTDYCLAHVPAA